MPMTEKQFSEYLMLYGADMENWPDDIQAEAIGAMSEPNIRALAIEQRYFEEVLRAHDVSEPNPWLADRIINAAGHKATRVSMSAWLQELLAFLLPQPAFAFATVLALGMAIGFSLPAVKEDSATPAYFEDASL